MDSMKLAGIGVFPMPLIEAVISAGIAEIQTTGMYSHHWVNPTPSP
jgi:hypothetical protein